MVDGLRVKDILKFGREQIDLDKYLPEYKRNKLPDRAFLWNLGKQPMHHYYVKKIHSLGTSFLNLYIRQWLKDR